jgi:lysyl oxidase
MKIRRVACAVVLAVACAASAAGGVPVAAASRLSPVELMPDLVTRPFTGITIQHSDGRLLLRFGTIVGNQGLGVLELRPRRLDCDGDGDFANDRLAIQRIYEDTDASGSFERGTDLIARTVTVGCMVFHPAHDHWHLQRFARYALRSIGSGEIVAASPKVSFCVRDSLPVFPDLPGFISTLYYGQCARNSITGLSVGWADLYDASLPGQDLDVTGLPNGRYCLTAEVDPRDGIDEADESNNDRSALLRLRDGTVEKLADAC